MYDYDLDLGKEVKKRPHRESHYSHDYPIDSQDALNNKIISSHMKGGIVIVSRPKTKRMRIALPMLDKKGKPMKQDGIYILKKIKTMDVLVGLEKMEFNFPISNWFNDSTTSSILEKREGQIIRECDDLGFALFSEMLSNPQVDHSAFIAWLYWIKGSITDTAKGIGGGAIEKAKTTITKAESMALEYRKDPSQFSEELNQKKPGMLEKFGIIKKIKNY